MTTQEVQRRETNLPALPIEGEVGLSGGLGREDIVTPTCSIVQFSSKSERGKPGKYWFPDGSAADRLEAVVLEIAGTRTLWAPVDSGEGAPVCRSADRQVGMTTKPSLVLTPEKAKGQNMKDDEMAYIPCELCRHFKDDVFGTNDWLCKPGYTLLLYEEERGPFLFFVKSSAVAPIMRTIVSPALMRFRQGIPAAPWRVQYEWTLKLVENDSGSGPQQKYYVPVIKALGPTDKPERYEAMAAELAGNVGRQMAAAVEEEGQQLLEPEGP